MILFYSEQQVAADVFIKTLRGFLGGQEIELLSLAENMDSAQPDLIIIDGGKFTRSD